MTEIPEVIQEKKAEVETVFMRTVVKKDVYNRLKEFAQQYSTGQGHWDFGVAIQILLEHYEESKMSIQSDKLDMILGMLSELPEKKEEKEEDFIEMLGGTKLSKR